MSQKLLHPRAFHAVVEVPGKIFKCWSLIYLWQELPNKKHAFYKDLTWLGVNSCLLKRKYFLKHLYTNKSEYVVQSIWLDTTENIPLGDSAKMEVAGRLLSELLHPSTSISAYYPHPRPHFPSESQTHWCIEAFTSHYFLGLEYGEAN